MKKIYISKPYLDNLDKKILLKTFDSTWISSNGENIPKFENNFSKFTGSNYSLTCSNGTIAIELSLRSLGINQGHEVIVPNITFAATINAVLNVGAKPILVDINKNNFGFEKKELKKNINKNTFAIIFVHLFGIPIDINSNLAGLEKNFFIIEDCAESLGSYINQKHTGNYGDCSTYSFFSNKIITTGEGGMINFKSKKVFEKASKIKNQGRSSRKYYWHDEIGGNYRLTNLQASLGLSQLKKIKILLEMRKNIYINYDQSFENNINIIPLHKYFESKFEDISCWYYTIYIKNFTKKRRDELMKFLDSCGVETRPMFYPLSDMKVFKKFLKGSDKNSKNISYKCMSLPTYPKLKKNQILYIVDKINLFLHK